MTQAAIVSNQSISSAIAQSLEASLQPDVVQDHPSPHFYCTQAFSDETFAQLRSHLPDSECYGGVHGRTGNERAKKSRLALPLNQKNITQLPDDLSPFWMDVASYFYSGDFLNLAIAAYRPNLHIVRPDLIKHSQFEIRFELLRDSTAYGIGPHSDTPKKVMTLLFYLSGGETSDSLGTSFYLPKQEGFTCQRGIHHDYSAFDLFKTYPYAPNAVLSFLRTDTSFHGVEVIEEQNVQRDVLRWMLWKK